MVASRMLWQLTQTLPARSFGARLKTRCTSRVQMLAASPYSVSLARRATWSRSANGLTTATGPKISSRTIDRSSSAPWNTVGST